jgi:hypothetical protein
MGVSSPGAFIGLFLVLVVALVLVSVGIFAMRSGALRMRELQVIGQSVAWHRQTLFLFGLNNIVFAFLAVFIIGIILFTNQTVRTICIVLVIATLCLSFVVLVRLILVSLQSGNKDVAKKKVSEEGEGRERELAE